MQLSVFTLALSLLAVVSALPLAVRDVFVPPVTSPKTGDIWAVGSKQNVTWDISDAPAQITNPNGTIVLAKGGRLDLKHPLASNFSILDGWHEVTVPSVPAGDDYTIVLFGDSGNDSENFTIAPAMLAAEIEL
ncbi:hypothetical protein L226DRAFT_544218 [Lentinus tigrinus ALCF2SS1-7]|uniref:Yeast cell wall synthesis Kre9/Knh1-like N-terminal domain-containing protein n=1 Tax=Lentinus tigrinus ALCF2SS1-6 TaxID=1328759 RepID=A0A5C2SGW1_9APHY|nr:hypothetical protein L227DRAFT_609697 [Lentinus tigrinus ALCF2SS1-6]RPD77727.1 hypothetical protein L226DRAFT_544218 [Lentinus tigrinus ALCF2SS1-7]